MLRALSISVLLATTLFGGLLDFRTLDKAKEAYEKGQYAEAEALYGSIDDKNDDLHYNLGDVYYKEKKYDEALKEYEQVHESALKAKTLHNIGNAYAYTQKIDEAIAAYEAALKLGEDEDTRYNLELLKKKKEEQQKQDQQKDDQQQDQKKDDQQKNDQNKQDQKDQQKQDQQQKNQDEQNKDQNGDDAKQQNQDKNGDSKEDQEKKEQQEKEQKAKEQQAKEDEKRDEERSKEEQGAMKEGEAKEEPISAMQERKYEKMLDKRGIKTLMVPLKTEGGPHEETTAW